ncbi:MAG: insulinase family protein, partial [Bacteroidales bacterium]|nr:insulinase family protein [Bacteroidales bacterium]
MSPERNNAPPSMFVEFLLNLDSRFFHLSNGIPVHIISGGTQEVMRIELVFRAGSWYQPAKSVATTTNFLIPNGTASRSADEISEYFDFYGSYLETNTGKDNAYLTLYTLNKHYKNTLPLLAEVLMDAVFPEQEVEIYKK